MNQSPVFIEAVVHLITALKGNSEAVIVLLIVAVYFSRSKS